MEIGELIEPKSRAAWRAWLVKNHGTKREIWLLFPLKARAKEHNGGITYLDSVEEALCFGWIDGLAKAKDGRTAQRFTPRRKGGNWTELNKERARRLIALGKMTPAGSAVLPDLDAPFVIPPEIERALKKAKVWTTFTGFPELYQRVRAGNIAEQLKNQAEFDKRLATLIAKTREGKMFGNWDDTGLARSE